MNKLFLLAAAAVLLPTAMSAGVVKGRVTAEGKPLAGVQVSDGRQIVLTNARGRYSMKTDKADSVVFITTPSGYIASPVDPIRPGFWQLLTKDPARKEIHNFELIPQDQAQYSIIFITDTHFANDPRRNDLQRFRQNVLPVVKAEYDKAAAKGAVYSVNLGDFAHDLYWYDYGLNEYEAEQFLVSSGYPAPLYSVSGNHDNDAGILVSEDVNDFESAWCYRHTWGPACYSVNIGGDHWIFMDSVEYLNTGKPDAKHKGMKGGRGYNCRFAEKDLDWLRKDLGHVSTDTRIFFCCHVPVFNDASKSEVMQPGQAAILDDIFKAYPSVYIFSGHTHKNIHTGTDGYDRFRQFIFGATSGSMWQNPEGYQFIGSDSSNQSINVLDCSISDPEPRYVAVNGSPKMMRIYDINAVGEFYRNDPQCRLLHKLYPQRSWYADPKFSNMIYVNYWGWAPGQKVEIFEDGKALEVEKSLLDEPLYVITYVAPKLKDNTKPSAKEAKDRKTPHSFVARASTATAPVKVRVTDASGKVLHEEELIRPKAFNKDVQ